MHLLLECEGDIEDAMRYIQFLEDSTNRSFPLSVSIACQTIPLLGAFSKTLEEYNRKRTSKSHVKIEAWLSR